MARLSPVPPSPSPSPPNLSPPNPLLLPRPPPSTSPPCRTPLSHRPLHTFTRPVLYTRPSRISMPRPSQMSMPLTAHRPESLLFLQPKSLARRRGSKRMTRLRPRWRGGMHGGDSTSLRLRLPIRWKPRRVMSPFLLVLRISTPRRCLRRPSLVMVLWLRWWGGVHGGSPKPLRCRHPRLILSKSRWLLVSGELEVGLLLKSLVLHHRNFD